MANQATKISTLTFTGGMNKDLDKHVRKGDTYLDARNFRLVADENSTTGSLENIKGNNIFDTTIINQRSICGSYMLRNKLIVFVSDCNTYYETPPSTTTSRIYVFELENGELVDSPTLIYEDNILLGRLLFSVSNPINAVGRYENEDVQKVYWVDGYNNFRWCNIVDPNLATQTVDKFDIYPNFDSTQPVIGDIATGSIDVSSVQYAYQFYIKGGATTMFSPCSNLIHLTDSDDYAFSTEEYKGQDKDKSSGKGVKVTVTNNDSYNYIRLVCIEHIDLNGIPRVRVFEDSFIDSDETELTFVDNGRFIDEITYQEFSILSGELFSARDLTIKNDLLFVGNINEEIFDIGAYDARAYRFDSALVSDTTTRLYDNYSDVTNSRHLRWFSGATLETSVWKEYLNNAATGTTYTTENIPEDFDCINIFNDYDNDADVAGYSNYSSKYDFSGTLGGSGLNIDFEFETYGIYTTGKGYVLDTNDFATSPTINVPLIRTAGTTESYMNLASPFKSYTHRGYMSDEIYRFGIVFFDERGRRSFVRWIADIRMPNWAEWCEIVYDDTDINAIPIFPRFNVKTLPTGAVGYQIVRCRRETIDDRNIVAQGTLCSTQPGGDGIERPDYYYDLSTIHSTEHYCLFITPEVNFGSNISWQANDQLHLIGFTSTTGTLHIVSEHYYDDTSYVTPTLYINKVRGWKTVEDVSWGLGGFENTLLEISGAEIIGPTDRVYNLSGIGFNSHNDAANHLNFKGTSLLIDKTAGNALWEGNHDKNIVGINDPGSGKAGFHFLCNYRRNNWLVQYGGNSHEVRASNLYIPCSNYTESTGTYIYTESGDNFINYFDHLNLSCDLSQLDANCFGEVVMFPVCSSYNLDLRHDDSFRRIYDAANVALIQEYSGVHENQTTTVYTQNTNYYLLNTVYSQENTTFRYLAKPLDDYYSLQDKFDVRVKVSDRKLNGEIFDSWLKFLPNNFIDVDSSYGYLSNIKTFKDDLLFWQERGFGVLAVNDRSLMQDSTGSQLVLGTGGVLDRYDYVSTKVGNKNIWGICEADDGIYWVNNASKELIAFSNGKCVPLSTVKGLKSYMSSNDYIVDAILVWDRQNNEILYTICPAKQATVSAETSGGGLYTYTLDLDATDLSAGELVKINNLYTFIQEVDPGDTYAKVITGEDLYDVDDIVYPMFYADRFTVCFNKTIGLFTGFYDFTPYLYIDVWDNFLSMSTVENYLYKHNVDDIDYYNKFYGVFYDSTLKHIVVNDYPQIKVFDNILFTTVVDSGLNTANKFAVTFDTLRCYNDYQNSDWLTLVHKTNLERRERVWSTYVPRNAVNVDVDTNPDIFDSTNLTQDQQFAERIRDNYMVLDFTFDNDKVSQSRINVSMINVKYRTSIR